MLTSRKKFLQQTGFVIAGSLLPYSKLLANVFTPPPVKPPPDVNHPMFCTNNLRDNDLFTQARTSNAYFTYYKTPSPIKDVLYALEEDLSGCVSPLPTADDCDPTNNHITNESALRYRAYFPLKNTTEFPNGHNYSEIPLPCLVFFHAGGFQECADFEGGVLATMCKAFARKGFIAISVEYRAGRRKDGTNTSAQQHIAPYRAIQDARGALRSIIKRNTVAEGQHDGLFIINPDQFFIGGMSAGAITALGATYYRNQSMINQAFPTSGASLTIEQALGNIDVDNYYGDLPNPPSIPNYRPTIRGVLNCWGGVVIPKSDDNDETDFFVGGNDLANPPMIIFHGYLDETVPYIDTDPLEDLQDIHFSTSSTFKKTNVCLDTSGSFIVKKPTETTPVSVKTCSSINLYNALADSRIDRFTEIYTDCNMRHGLDDKVDGVETSIADFATGFADTDQVGLYIVQRSAVFFQAIMNYSTLSGHPPFGYVNGKTKFFDCVNNRICTDSGDNNNCPTNDPEICTLET